MLAIKLMVNFLSSKLVLVVDFSRRMAVLLGCHERLCCPLFEQAEASKATVSGPTIVVDAGRFG
jgi:hypothetical protein